MVSEKTNQLYRNILRRIYAEENYKRLCVFHNPACSDDEDRIWEIDPAMDDLAAKRYINELE